VRAIERDPLGKWASRRAKPYVAGADTRRISPPWQWLNRAGI
jgi:hypothetical protein